MGLLFPASITVTVAKYMAAPTSREIIHDLSPKCLDKPTARGYNYIVKELTISCGDLWNE
jgi:hypothetical protein